MSTGAFGGVCVVGGTSLAAPHVTAVASVLWQKDKSVSADFIRSLLAFTANQYGEDYEYGNGLVDLNFALSQYDAFKEVYVKDADVLNEQVSDAIEDGALEVNEKPVETFTDVTYVEGSWGQHGTFAELTSIESGNKLSTNGITVVKLGAVKTDKYFSDMRIYPELHGFTSKQPDGVQNFEYFSNYVYSYIYLTEIASGVYGGKNPMDIQHTVTATCISSCKNHTVGWCVAQSRDQINGCFDGNSGLNTDSGVKSWNTVFKEDNGNITNTEKNRGLFIYGIALHTITDLFAHNTYMASTGEYIKHPDADNAGVCSSRYACAKLAAQYVISHIKRQRAGAVSDFYNAVKDVIYTKDEDRFTLGRFNQYIKAVDPIYYSDLDYQSVFDAMTH